MKINRHALLFEKKEEVLALMEAIEQGRKSPETDKTKFTEQLYALLSETAEKWQETALELYLKKPGEGNNEAKYGYIGLLKTITKLYCKQAKQKTIFESEYAFKTLPELQSILDSMLTILDPKEKEVIELFFGLENGVHVSHQVIAEYLGHTRQYTSVLATNAINKLSNPLQFQKLVNKNILPDGNEKVEALGLSNKTYNVVRRAGIDTINELIEIVRFNPGQLLRARSCGQISMNEITKKVEEFIKLKETYA